MAREIELSIRSKLGEALTPVFLELANESRRHRRPEGSETHFKLLLVSDRFHGVSRVDRQKMVYNLLKAELAGPVHALTMKLYDRTEWEQLPIEARTFKAIGHHPAGRTEDE